jgi:hypothetical protein
MSFIQHFGGEIKPGTAREFQAWLATNEKEFGNSYPEGARYLGTYFAMYSSDKTGGTVHTFVELENYGTQDVLAAAAQGNDTYATLLDEFATFFNQESPDWTSALYKKVTAASIFGE